MSQQFVANDVCPGPGLSLGWFFVFTRSRWVRAAWWQVACPIGFQCDALQTRLDAWLNSNVPVWMYGCTSHPACSKSSWIYCFCFTELNKNWIMFISVGLCYCWLHNNAHCVRSLFCLSRWLPVAVDLSVAAFACGRTSRVFFILHNKLHFPCQWVSTASSLLFRFAWLGKCDSQFVFATCFVLCSFYDICARCFALISFHCLCSQSTFGFRANPSRSCSLKL